MATFEIRTNEPNDGWKITKWVKEVQQNPLSPTIHRAEFWGAFATREDAEVKLQALAKRHGLVLVEMAGKLWKAEPKE